ncbi:hypothetical protein [Corynebacterium bovis]|uniref:ABC-type glycine betaine transport system substrate-binding domain-containing protein n=1 Tax=Corynebacterium bovis DSM 20582 = CIP 54.80 TaxID=927655 RepID=A0A8H9Y9A5_9CORY|nr:hypothetical protein [Corynebacterium bovis]MBB3116395.1 hypothetical protein [Corynebacterium bovis DSM 20582 = CIP 54.80]QQC47521.1 hypothetical protein I6I09_00495 [Corynebacterium bovis]RRO82857.1 hypothetical protein CXF36_04880 [Corynebacterium bovis]RRO84351.1 hypothetical protein CXF37_03450 [Corynebacterium bovis]RRO96463.1 hypothetical protein CXF29_02045 [Corynebacterium bovis]
MAAGTAAAAGSAGTVGPAGPVGTGRPGQGGPLRRIGRALRVATVAVVCVGTVGVAACGAYTPGPGPRPTDRPEVVTIGVDGSTVQKRLAETYTRELAVNDREATTVAVPSSMRVDAVRDGKVDLVIGCVGELLDVLNPDKGRQLRVMYREDGGEDTDEWRDITHSTMLSALPSDLDASDPGIAVGCDDPTLPQNIVAVYRRGVIDRDDRQALNWAAGGTTSEDLGVTETPTAPRR